VRVVGVVDEGFAGGRLVMLANPLDNTQITPNNASSFRVRVAFFSIVDV
jgi:hypothetical protein